MHASFVAKDPYSATAHCPPPSLFFQQTCRSIVHVGGPTCALPAAYAGKANDNMAAVRITVFIAKIICRLGEGESRGRRYFCTQPEIQPPAVRLRAAVYIRRDLHQPCILLVALGQD